ncbi:hypothetical protein FRC19_001525 [Serendipita sp. 401]|nr:hypothetical protein FRC19_001525 [Serendipita sp. 401]
MFGAWGTNNANNQNQPAAGGFGTTNAFGQPAQTTGGFGAFGQPQQNAQPATGFGAAAQPNQGFGGFGAATTGFAPKPNAFGTTGGFGAAATPTTGTGGFGGFGGGTAAPNTGFGQTNTNTATTGFGTGFGATNNNNTANNAWGKTTTGGFGAAQAPAATATGQGTANPPFQEFTERDTGATNVTLHYHSISCMPAYQNWSAEELRAQDYAIGRKTASSNVPAAGGFGANAGGFGAATGAGGFGQPPAQAGGFGGFGGATTNTTGGLFGNTNPAGAGTFGATTTPAATNPFGQNTTTNTNAPTNPFAPAAPATGTGLFGGFGGANTNTTNAFGANNNATKPGFGGFGNTTNTTGATGFGGFGANANTNQAPAGATNAFGQPNTTNAFGGFGANNANAPKPGFGAANTAFGGATNNAFGQPANNAFGQPAQPAATGFGATPAQGANTTGGFGGFGQTNPATPANPFGQPNQTNNANPFGGFGQTGAQQGAGTTGGFGGLFGPKPATPTTTGGFNGFGQQGVGATGTNPLAATNPSGTGAPGTNLFGQPANNGLFGARPGGLFGANNTTSNPFGTFGQPAAGGLGNTVVANPATNTAVNPFSSFAAFGQSTAAPAPTTTATTNLFGASTAQPPQQALTASVDQPFSAGVPMFELLPGKSVATAGALAVSAFGAKKQPNFFMKRKPLPSAKTVASFNASTLNNNLRGFAGSVTTTKPFGQSGISLMLKGGTTPSTSSSLSSFGSSFMTGSLSEKKGLSSDVFNNRIGDSVKKLTLDKPISNEQLSSSLAKVAAKKSTGSTLELTRGSSAGGSSASYVRGGVVPKAIEPPREQAETEKLEKGDYWIEPSEPILVATAFKDLEAVKGFKCGRVGYGEVQFLDSVNLTTVGAVKEIPGRFIIFEERECTVYPDESEKPPVGQGLNVRARITLEGCWATDRATREPIKDENHPKHVAHVRKLKKIPNTTFEKFEIEKGEWTFIVEHFSRYGLNADDDEEEEEEVRWAEAGATAPGDETMRDQIMEQQSSEGDEVAMPEIRASVRPRSVSLLPRSPHHRRTSANRGEENDADDDADVEEVGMEEDELQERMAPSWPAQLGMDPQRMGQMQSSLFAPQRSSSVNRAPSKQPRISSRPPRSGTPSALGKHPREIAILEEEDGMDMGAVQRRHASVEVNTSFYS